MITSTAPTEIPPAPSLVGHYAGAVSRFLSYPIDVIVSGALFAVGSAAVTVVVNYLFDTNFADNDGPGWAIALAVWEFVYFWYSWALAGKTPGMAMLGILVVKRDGTDLSWIRAFIRALVFPISFMFFGLGFIGLIIGRERRALHDVAAGSVVVYAWDARAARLRLLARSSAA
jgi:uncharacterized RDD family membrane protein YckC